MFPHICHYVVEFTTSELKREEKFQRFKLIITNISCFRVLKMKDQQTSDQGILNLN